MLNLNEFVKKFKDQYRDPDEFEMDAQTEFKTVGSWDSLTGMAILVMIYDDFKIDFPQEKLKACKTVKDVYDTVIKMI